jgi:transposase
LSAPDAQEPHRLIFVDETQTFVAALRCDGLSASWIIERPMNRQIVETWIETQLALTLQPSEIVILDNLSSHKSKKAKTILKERVVPVHSTLLTRP